MESFKLSDILEAMRRAMNAVGLAPEQIIADGQLHRCPVEGKPRGRDGAYVAHLDNPASIWFQNFRTGISDTWSCRNGDMSQAERETLRQRADQARAMRESAQRQGYEKAAAKAQKVWDQATLANKEHPYLVRKQVLPCGDIRQKGDDLVVPVFSAEGVVQSLQFIAPEKSPETGRDKTFLPGGRIAGGFFPIKDSDDDTPLLITEGFATGATLYAATGRQSLPPSHWSVWVAFTANNLEAVARMAREKYPARDIILAADNDVRDTDDDTPNTGLVEAAKAALAIGGRLAIPMLPDGGKCDFNDVGAVLGLAAVAKQVEKASAPLSAEPGAPTGSNKNPSLPSFEQEPLPLPPARPSAPALPPELCPPALAAWWQDLSARAEMPLEYVAAASIVVLSSLVGRRCAIRPRRVDDWTVIPNLWGAVVGRPGTMKSLAVEVAAAPLQTLVDAAHKEHAEVARRAKARKTTLDLERKELEKAYQKAFKNKDFDECRSVEDEIGVLQSKMEDECNPKERRFLTSDASTEKLLEMMRDNPNGLLLKRDEISGWMRSLNRSDRQGDRELYLETWGGSTPYNQDRIGRGEVYVPAMCLSVLGTTQPAKLATYVRGAIKGTFEDDGFLQRFQLLVWSEPYTGPAIERKPDRNARNCAYMIHQALAELQPENIGATEGVDGTPYVKFSSDAQDLFDTWLAELKERLRSPEMEPYPAFESHLAKFKSLMPSLALIFHLVEGGRAPVSLQAAALAANWCDFLEQHARKVYAEELGTDMEGAHALAVKIKEGTVRDGWTIRDIYRQEWSGLATAQDTWSAVKQLAALNWLTVAEIGEIGRKQQVVYINPRVQQ